MEHQSKESVVIQIITRSYSRNNREYCEEMPENNVELEDYRKKKGRFHSYSAAVEKEHSLALEMNSSLDLHHYNQSAMHIRLGLCCINSILRDSKPPIFCSRSMTLASIEKRGLQQLQDLCIQNIKDLIPMIQ